MKQITFCRNYRRGASLMIALVIFMLCALAGVSAFVMATANAGRYAHSSDQEYYSVSSAALLFVDMFDEFTYTAKPITFTYEREWTYTGTDSTNEHSSTDSYTLDVPEETTLGDMAHASTLRGSSSSTNRTDICTQVALQCNKLIPYLSVPGEWYARVKEQAGAPQRPTSVAPMSYSFTISIEKTSSQGGGADSRFEPVSCTLTMSADYNLVVTFAEASGAYSIIVYWPATVTATPTAADPKYEYAPSGGGYDVGRLIQVHTLEAEIEWNKKNVTISRGALQGGN